MSQINNHKPFQRSNIGKAPETGNFLGGGSGQLYRPPMENYDTYESESMLDDSSEELSAILYNDPIQLKIDTADPTDTLATQGYRHFDRSSFLGFFEKQYSKILMALMLHGVIDLRNRIYWFPSILDMMKILSKSMNIPIKRIPKRIKNNRSNIEDDIKSLLNLSFEVVSFLINGLPKLNSIGTINEIAFRNTFPTYSKHIEKRLQKKKVVITMDIITIPPFNIIAEVLGEDELDKKIHTQKLVTILLNGLGQYTS